MSQYRQRPRGVTVIAVVNTFAAVITLAFWTLVYLRLFSGHAASGIDRSALASTLGFLVADLIWAVPVLILSVFGLWKLRFWGWTTAQAANILWCYSLTALLVRDLSTGAVSPGIVLFLPFALFSIWAAIYLWTVRQTFMADAKELMG